MKLQPLKGQGHDSEHTGTLMLASKLFPLSARFLREMADFRFCAGKAQVSLGHLVLKKARKQSKANGVMSKASNTSWKLPPVMEVGQFEHQMNCYTQNK